jgi:hypothetical protein
MPKINRKILIGTSLFFLFLSLTTPIVFGATLTIPIRTDPYDDLRRYTQEEFFTPFSSLDFTSEETLSAGLTPLWNDGTPTTIPDYGDIEAIYLEFDTETLNYSIQIKVQEKFADLSKEKIIISLLADFTSAGGSGIYLNAVIGNWSNLDPSLDGFDMIWFASVGLGSPIMGTIHTASGLISIDNFPALYIGTGQADVFISFLATEFVDGSTTYMTIDIFPNSIVGDNGIYWTYWDTLLFMSYGILYVSLMIGFRVNSLKKK